MTDYKTAKVMRALGAYEIPTQSLFVGGCVRNTLLGLPVSDIDIATLHPPLTVIAKLEKDGIRYVPTGLEHGTVTALIEDTTFEITTLRKDMDTDGRHAVIAFAESWMEDAQRRDFTINTLLASPDGMIFDPTGAGLSDLDKKRVVFVGEPRQRIAEDYLRILRFFRFYSLYSEGAPDPAALAASMEYAPKIGALSKERVTQELLKIIGTRRASQTLDLMFSHDVLLDMAEDYAESLMARLCDLQVRHEAIDPLPRLLVLGGMKPDAFLEKLSLSNAQKDRLRQMADGTLSLKTITRKKLRALVHRSGNTVALQSYLLRLAERDEFPDLDLLDIVRYWQAPVFPVGGADLIAAGYQPGPALGAMLSKLEEGWIAKDFPEGPIKIPKKKP